ncbi:MAG: 4-(cytidine 5'-diphospho)-2-C-methyl-D-erythritol kinase [Acidobacteria bacterium]|nr:4-(cytidine 5'-diphospho)-2-C-methyl-D-erythritol kinase [Acidobacteriota bacterium]
MSVRVLAYAKINLHLKVLFPRPDGYHEIRTVFQTIGLADELFLRRRPDGVVRLECDDPALPVDESNLCLQAVRRLQERHPAVAGLDIRLQKRIPAQAGLGGGSADAAAVLAGVHHLWAGGIPAGDLVDIATALGADVSFFLHGGTAAGVGRGEELILLPDLPPRPVLIVCPAQSVSTSWAYGRLNFILTKAGYNTKIPPSFRGLSSAEVFLDDGENDFESVVFSEFPGLKTIKHALLEVGASRAMLSGSGSAVFGLFTDEDHCQQAAKHLQGRLSLVRIFRTNLFPRREYHQRLRPWVF